MIRCRQMSLPELRMVLGWAAEEGWNPGKDDAEAFWAADPDGFFVAEEDGEPIAAISVVVHSPDFAFLGLYICRPSHRGRGVGLALWRHGITHAGNRTIGLDGVPEQQAKYARSGFRHAGETVRYVGQLDTRRSDNVRPATPDDVSALVALEARASGWSKPAYLAAWVSGTPTRTTYVLESGHEILGFATLRACQSGAKVGPLIAPTDQMAMALLRHATAMAQTDVTIDIPDQADAFADMCQAQGLAPGFRTARMYRGIARPDRGQSAMLYGVTTLELG